MTERLTTLAAVKAWLEITTDGGDTQLIRLIDAASQFALNYMNRDGFAAQEYTENFKGNGKHYQMLRNWPVLSISSVGVNGKVIEPSTIGTAGKPGNGYVLSDRRLAPQSVELVGWDFWFRSPCQVIYRAGFETSQEMTIPTPEVTVPPTPVVYLTPTAGGQWIGDLGVAIDDIIALKVEGDPASGQYAVDEWGTYAFSADDAGKIADISYSYVPMDVAQGVTELIGEWYKRKDRIGLLSKTLGGQETVTFMASDMNDSIRGMLQPYRNVVPI